MTKAKNRKEEPAAHGVVSITKGWVAVEASSRGIRRISLPHLDPAEALSSLDLPQPVVGAELDPEAFEDLGRRLERYFEGEVTSFPDALDLKGTDFQKSVWEVARTIPWGETRSYSWIAREIGKPRAARAVGQAMRANPAPIIVPCHRVIGEQGDLRGYGGPDGIGLKRELLDIESGTGREIAAGEGGY